VCSGSLFQRRRAASIIALARVLRAGLVPLRETTMQRKLYRPAPVLITWVAATFLQHLMISDQHYPPDPPEFEWVKSRVQVAKVQWLCRHREEGFYPPCTHRLCAEGLYRPFPDSGRKVEGPGWQLEECTHISLNIYLSWVFKIDVQKFGY